jgi:hypothetical protein
METVLRYFIAYKDSGARQWEGDSWNCYSFATEAERTRMIADIQSAESVWREDAVPYFTFEREVPVALISEGGE